ncbi:acyl-CoA dehydrogenase family protein [Streptomyces sp. NPDC013433]|uniref:acyl-CoA dehydrogenase family protein n=1 Tax=Streptomyces sp. NPDC013433 TaxID=3155604 RepID=UPI003455EAA8
MSATPGSSGPGVATAVDATAFAASVRDDAAVWDLRGRLPDSVRRQAASAGLLGVALPTAYGGAGGSPDDLARVCVRVGAACSSLRGLVTVQEMVAAAVLRWGTPEQRAQWLPPLARGEVFAGFAATEEGAGTALAEVDTRVRDSGDDVLITGRKLWITFGQTADVFLVLGKGAGGPLAVLVEGDRPGVHREPVQGHLGMRAAGIAHVSFEGVRVPRSHLVGPPGLGLHHIIGTALDHGRFTVAWGCVGMAEACLDAAAVHAARRTQGGVALAEHQLVRSVLARAAVDTAAAHALCTRATRSRAERRPEAVTETVLAKYAAARTAADVSSGAVRILGATGIAPDSLAGRFFRDAKVMQLIEGSEHVSELHIADRLLRRHGVRRADGSHPPEAAS